LARTIPDSTSCSAIAPLLLALTVAVAVSCAAPARTDLVLEVQGHRGARGLLPENTLPAFSRALELGVTTLELDLQVTRDRVLVVYHDQRLDPRRCIRDDGLPLEPRRLKDLSWEDLRSVDCGLKHPDFSEQQPVRGARIPRFTDVLDLASAADYPVRINAEIKLQNLDDGVPVPDFAQLVVDALSGPESPPAVTVQSFRPAVLAEVHRLVPEIPLAILVSAPAEYDRLVAESGATVLSPDFRRLHRRQVERYHARGLRVVPWTVNDPDDIRRMIRWGVDGIISDYPGRVIAICRSDPSCRPDH